MAAIFHLILNLNLGSPLNVMELAPIDHNGAKTGPYIVIRGVKGGVCGGGGVVCDVVYGVSCGETYYWACSLLSAIPGGFLGLQYRLSQSVATWQRRCEAQHILRGTKWKM